MKKYLLLFSLIILSLCLFIINTNPVTAATRCKNDSQCATKDVCKIPNPDACAAIGNKDPSACYKYCEKVLGSYCKKNNDCPGQLVCKVANPDQCAKIGGKDPAACKKTCQNPPPTPTDTPPPSQCYSDAQCPQGQLCVGFNPYECAHDSINCNGHCAQTAATATPTNTPTPQLPPCKQWNSGNCKNTSTAVGTFSTDTTGFIKTVFDILLSISGGIALLLIIKAGYQLLTSQGKPQQVQEGRDQLIAAIVGLIFLIFSFVALQLLGFDILHIPGFGK